MTRNERKAQDAFWEEIRSVERRHGYRITIEPSYRIVAKPLVPEVSGAARRTAEEIANGPRLPWWKRILNLHTK